MTQNTKNTGGNGNTKHSPRSRNWFVTLNNPSNEEIETLKTLTSQLCTAFEFQIEEGNNKTPHIQGAFIFRDAKGFEWWKDKFPRIHVETVRNKKAALEYCCKPEGRLDGPWSKGKPEPIETISNIWGWQIDCKKIVDDWSQGKRKIHWYWEPKGKFGKSDLAKYFVVHYNCLVLSGKSTDMKNGIIQYTEGHPERKNKLIIILDIPRVNIDYISYEAIESIKNGLFYSGKYEGGMCVMNPPIIICFANEPPKTDKLSEDRWVIRNIREVNEKKEHMAEFFHTHDVDLST